ncbi:hypothetical protein ACFS2C_06645 [Prauserella oleivorans]|uniref:Uncharacterized protein n=1 Tax=Prauserella oleivorans TaxID=1478153 RepID=A0ABW5W664_9PSEU
MLSARTTLTPTEAAVLARVDSVEPVELAAVRLGLHAAAAVRILARARAIRARAEADMKAAAVLAPTVATVEVPFGRPTRVPRGSSPRPWPSALGCLR